MAAVALGTEHRFELRRIGLLRRDALPGGVAGAKRDNLRLRSRR